MTREEKLNKVIKVFLQLPEEKQDYILGVLQALAFANETVNRQMESLLPDSEQEMSNTSDPLIKEP